MVSCCAYGCKKSSKNSINSFYRIPKIQTNASEFNCILSRRRREKWLLAIRKDESLVNPSTRICSDHFITGKNQYNHLCMHCFCVFWTILFECDINNNMIVKKLLCSLTHNNNLSIEDFFR